ncbi:4Fe-4S binding protein [bacterium]|nr:4Fe-4S binding protein [bacterium]
MNNAGQAIHIKKEILVRIIEAFFSDDFEEQTRLIPYVMRPKGMEVPYRCCVYKERAIIKDRAIAGLGFSIEDDDETVSLAKYARKAIERREISEKNLTVLQAACKGCSTNRIYVTDLCQGCVARPCLSSCKFGAISIENGRSVVDDSKCKKCQMCVKACPYKAIVKISVPCEDACPVGAIKKDETGFASIDFEKCINCGKCIANCPFGAVHERSQIVDILKAIKSEKKVIVMIAPSIAGQFPGNIYQLKSAIIKAGFDDVYEVAQGADVTAANEAKEFTERMKEVNAKASEWVNEWVNEGGYDEKNKHENDEEKKVKNFMTTSCCAGYNQLIKKHMPEIKPYVSETKTPMYYTAEIVKQDNPDSVTVFISPCVAKRAEGFENPNVDYIMNFEELGALFVAKKIQITECEEMKYPTESSKQARNFGFSGGVADSVKAALKDENSVKPCVINGLNKESIRQLKSYAASGSCEGNCNLIEVMCCEGGCIGGNATMNNQRTAKKLIEQLSNESKNIDKI